MHPTSTDAACPGLYRKPLDATIGQLITQYCPNGRQGDRQTNDNDPLPFLAVLMAVAMWGYNTPCITWWRWSRASQLEAAGCHYRASIFALASINWTLIQWIFRCFLLSTCWKRPRGKRIAPINNRGVAYQTDGKHLSKTIGCLVGGFNIAFNCIKELLTLRIT